jgi:LysM repeat protein
MFNHGRHMLRRDKQRPHECSLLGFSALVLQLLACAFALTCITSCNRMITPRGSQLVKDADARAAEGDFLRAVDLYETALDGSTSAAEIHYKLALLYDDKMNEPLNALHHFKRYLTIAPNGSHATEAKNFMKRDELALVTSMSGDAVVTRTEAARLKNENLSLRKEIEEKAAQTRVAATAEKAAAKGAHADKTATNSKSTKSAPRSHVVESGDTLFSLSREYYGSTDRWKDIRRANQKKLDSGGKLKVGQTLTIP